MMSLHIDSCRYLDISSKLKKYNSIAQYHVIVSSEVDWVETIPLSSSCSTSLRAGAASESQDHPIS